MRTWYRLRLKSVVIAMVGVYLHTTIFAPTLMALTGGPSQPEVQSFDPVSTTQLVNPFTGDFTYNIPLMDVGGYPVNLTYHSGITMDQEASFVGLGWSLNPGVINRNVRGLPDDFAGEKITKQLNLKKNVTAGATVGVGLEVFGYSGLITGLNLGLNHNSYHGAGIDFGFSAGVTAGEGASTGLTLGLGVSSNSGVTVRPSVSFSGSEKVAAGDATFGGGIGISLNSREGLQALTLRRSFDMSWARINGGASRSSGTNFSFVTPSYPPTITTPMQSSSGSFRLRIGGELFGTTGNMDVVGFTSEQRVAEPEYKIPGYGYLYAHKAGDATQVLHDFNREKDGNFHPAQPNLPLTHSTYDLYAVSAQGIQAQFRPFRSDIGTVFDHRVSLSGIAGFNAGGEIAGGNSVKGGLDLVVNTVASEAGKWTTDNPTQSKFQFRGPDPAQPIYEPVYFKQIGETSAMSASNRTRFEDMGGFDPIRIKLNEHNATMQLERPNSEGTPLPSLGEISTVLTDREPRNYHLSFLTAREADEFGLEKGIRDYGAFWEIFDESARTTTKKYSDILRVDESRLPHHLSEITAIRDDGSRYIYGLPVYNTLKEEVSFNVSGEERNARKELWNVPRPLEGLVSYNAGTDDSSNNNNGTNGYFNKITTPPYAYAFLLTAVVSPDYVDRTDDGPTSDDLGTYTKFNYRRYHDEYRWRTPYTDHGLASYEQGQLADKYDNTGSYVYGTKEVWYLHSIESKNFVAEFHLSPRDDGKAIKDHTGGKPTVLASGREGFRDQITCPKTEGFSPTVDDSQRLYKLDCIQLFNKAERLKKRDEAVPLKTVHFIYDYSLTPNVANGAKKSAVAESERVGKLTLKKLAFSYRDSEKALLSPYVFRYADLNPAYDSQATDRWGTFQPNREERPNRRFPYTEQDPGLANTHAAAWHLTSIGLPSGGLLSVDYEADEYAYVQDKRAMQMFPIVATGKSNVREDGTTECEKNDGGHLYDSRADNLCLFFKLNEPLASTQTHELTEYVRGIEELYVNARVTVGSANCDDVENCQEIQTFLKPDINTETNLPLHGLDRDSEVSGTRGLFARGWIKIKGAKVIPGGYEGEEDRAPIEHIHPLALATWQNLRLNLPKLVYRQPAKSDIEDLATGNPTLIFVALPRLIGGLLEELWSAVRGFNKTMHDAHRANRIDLDTSFMRLNHPTKRKIGGGSRVRRITLNNQWGRMSQPAASPDRQERADTSYIQEYSYTMEEPFGSELRTISSGVAAYEPLVGGDENPFVQPLWYEHNDDPLFQLAPIGESLYPSPVVGYSKVKVRHLTPDPRIVGTGSTAYEFHTAKDFPVRVTRTNFPPFHSVSGVEEFLSPIPMTFDHLTASQGFAIELNDMHGKPKATRVYQEGPAIEPISGYTYHYLTSESDPTQLDNERMTMVKHDPEREVQMEPRLIGLTYDITVDSREHLTEVSAPGVQINADGFLAGVFPIVVPIPYPEYSSESRRFRSMVITKAIFRTGILKEVRAHDSGASLSTFNEVWDAKTGNVVMTRTETEHGTFRYTTRISAHLGESKIARAGMAGAWLNQGITFQDVAVMEGGVLAVGDDASQYFFPGDELLLRPPYEPDLDGGDDDPDPGPPDAVHAWVWQVQGGGVRLIDRNGNHIPPLRDSETGAFRPFEEVKIMRSGHRNQQTANIGHVTTLSNPIREEDQTIQFENVLDTAALEYAQHWQTYGPFHMYGEPPSCECEDLDFHRPPWTVGPEPSPSHVALADLLRELQGKNKLQASSVELASFLRNDPSRDDLYGVFLYLKANESLEGWSTWEGSLEGSVFTGKITDADDQPLCSISLRNPNGVLTTPMLDNLRFDSISYRRDARYECGGTNKFKLYSGNGSEQQVIYGESTCFAIEACEVPDEPFVPQYQCSVVEGKIVNPFVEGILGNWRPYKTWSYLANRVPFIHSMDSGRYASFEPFWSGFRGQNTDNWHWTEKTTVIDPFGKARESQDALDRYSSEMYGFDFSVVKAAAKNARASQMAVEDFEDYAYSNRLESVGQCAAPTHWSFQGLVPPWYIDPTPSHSGQFSLRLIGESVTVSRPIENQCEESRMIPSTPLYHLQRCDVIQPFNPLPGEYVLSAWVHINSRPDLPLPGPGPQIEVKIGSATFMFKPSGMVIDGWQRIVGPFTVPNDEEGSIEVTLNSLSGVAWFDDIRIHPFDAQMETYVYDATDLRFRAALDAQNYSTFYDYDEEGALSRVKQETVKGTMTIKEVSRGAPKNFEFLP